MTDPIADMLTRIRNAQLVKKSEVILPYSRIKFKIAQILEQEGFIGKVKKVKNVFDEICIELKYNQKREPAIKVIKRISKPGCRIYVSKDKLPNVLSGFGVAVISTSQGLMTNKEAKKQKLGGELICAVY